VLTRRFHEGALNFKPTFKFDYESDVYDTSKKMRVPSWTDRVLYKPDSCKLLAYTRCDCKFSDHRPVLGIFECTTKKVDRKKETQVLDHLLARLNERIEHKPAQKEK